jgi:signal transduction histidine kinase
MTETRLNVNELLQNAFPELEPEDVEALGEAARIRTYPVGVDICRQGERGTNLFVLGRGEADIIVHADDHHEILVDTIGPNTYFGEMAFLGETTRSATIRTRDICHMLVIDHTDFEPVADANPGLLRRLLRQVIGHLRRNDRAVINELNLNHAALQKAYADLAEQEELRTEFIATVSHELRTPLTSIQGFLGLLNQGAIKGESLKVALDSITRNVQKMVGLTNDLLFLYEMHPAKPEYTYQNLADLLIEALNAAKETMDGEATNVMLDIASDIPKVHVDKRTLILAIRALIENAFKFNPDKKPIRIEAYCARDEEVAVAIKDEGVGIPAEAQQRIFDPFARLETEGGSHLFPGLGVGLTIARFVVERHNGRIEVDSQVGDGSTFTIFLPQSSYTPPE